MIENIDCFYAARGYIEIKCRTCGSVCNAERNRPGADFHTYAYYLILAQTPIPPHLDKHDRFMCPHVNDSWHVNATNLRDQINKSLSPSLQKIMEDDLKQIIKDNIKSVTTG